MVAIGIDLGTTNSCVSVFKNGKVEIITNSEGYNITPSYVGFSDQHGRIIGDDAKKKAPFDPENTIFDAKRLIGRKFNDPHVQNDIKHWPFKVIDENTKPKIQVTFKGIQRSYYPEEISSMILDKLKSIAEKYLNTVVKDCVITVPAYFNDSQRQATIDAGTLAGLNVMKIINEPTAAAIAYGFDNKVKKEQIVLVFDLGGGTFDVSILKINGLEMRVLATGGDTHLGGEDFDSNVMKYVIAEFEKNHGVKISKNRAIRRIRTACEKAKIQISAATTAKIEILSLVTEEDDAIAASKGLDMCVELTRDKFEFLNSTLFESTLKYITDCLKTAKLNKNQIDEIVLVGGSSRIPKVRSIVKNFFNGKELNKTINPDEAMAIGAAIRAASLSDEKCKEIKDCSLSDVTSMSLGIRVVSQETEVVVPKNTSIPVKKIKQFYTAFDNQTTSLFPVIEGEHRMARDNNLLGEFTIMGIPPKRAGEIKFDVSFDIDDNGILTVNSTETSRKLSNQIVIKQEKGRLTQTDKDRIIEDNRKAREEELNGEEVTKIKNKIYDYCYDKMEEAKNHKRLKKSAVEEIVTECQIVVDWIDDNPGKQKMEYNDKYNAIKSFCDGKLN